jgi:phosphohistidine phosphatase
MRLFLVRHGEASLPEADPARGLNRRGRSEAERVGKELARLGARPALIRCSLKTRAQQTAEIIAAALGSGLPPVSTSGLSPNDPVEPLAAELQTAAEDQLLVSHLPFLPALAGRLLAGEAPPGHVFGPAGVLILERDQDGVWSVAGQIDPAAL